MLSLTIIIFLTIAFTSHNFYFLLFYTSVIIYYLISTSRWRIIILRFSHLFPFFFFHFYFLTPISALSPPFVFILYINIQIHIQGWAKRICVHDRWVIYFGAISRRLQPPRTCLSTRGSHTKLMDGAWVGGKWRKKFEKKKR